MINRIVPYLSAAALALCASIVFAADEVTFESLDGNGDGFIAMDEIPADHVLARNFATYDVDGDGRLSMAEFDSFKSGKDSTSDY